MLDRAARRAAGRTAATAERLVVAYEPVWAIGTGRTPTSADIAQSHAAIRHRLARLAADGADVAILYGGSVKADNAGRDHGRRRVSPACSSAGASLDAAGFWSIYQAGGGA